MGPTSNGKLPTCSFPQREVPLDWPNNYRRGRVGFGWLILSQKSPNVGFNYRKKRKKQSRQPNQRKKSKKFRSEEEEPIEPADNANKAVVKHLQLQLVRDLLFTLPAIHWSLPHWDTDPWLPEPIVNTLMWLESVVCMVQSIASFQRQQQQQ
jgi:hypothetical protein